MSDQCPRCKATVLESHQFCPTCGLPREPEAHDPTVQSLKVAKVAAWFRLIGFALLMIPVLLCIGIFLYIILAM